MDGVVQVPGWANIWTQPIINGIDMLATGARTEIGVKVFGETPDLEKIKDGGARTYQAALRQVNAEQPIRPPIRTPRQRLLGNPTSTARRAARYGMPPPLATSRTWSRQPWAARRSR